MYISDISKNRKETRRAASESIKTSAIKNSAADRSENDSASISSRSNKDAMKIAGNHAIMAAICLVFDVDWDEEFLDDEYVIECRRSEIHEVQV